MTRPLSPRQAQVMRLMLAGFPRKRIAAELGLDVGTVKVHMAYLYHKVGVQNRDELAAKFMRPTDEARRLMETGA